jgi:hypothetical protein
VPDIPKWVTEPLTANVSSSQFNSRNFNRTGSSSTRDNWLGLPPKAPVGYQGSGPIFATVRGAADVSRKSGASLLPTVRESEPTFAPLPAAREALAQLHEQQQVTRQTAGSSSSSGAEKAVAGSTGSSGAEKAVAGSTGSSDASSKAAKSSTATASSGTTEKHHAHAPVTSPKGNCLH